jgi:hypothetical protein
MFLPADEMYRCEVCKSVVPAHTPTHRVVAETRPATYPHRREANHPVKKKDRMVKPDDPGGQGMEIVRELVMCPRCAGA